MSSKNNDVLLGAHMSIAGGFDQAIKAGESIGCTAIQIFTKSNRQWHAKKIDPQDATNFKTTWKNSTIKKIIAHASYLINLGSPNVETQKKSVDALIKEIERCALLDIPYLVLHPGSRGSSDENIAIDTISAHINDILAQTNSTVSILLEIMAGQGTSVCYTLEQLSSIIHKIKHKRRIGVCFDTCHAWAAGYDFHTPNSYHAFWEKFEQLIGISHVHAIHVNDSKQKKGSHVDRHEHIGKGTIGLEAFRLLMNDKRFKDVPKILETPKTSLDQDIENLRILRSLIKK